MTAGTQSTMAPEMEAAFALHRFGLGPRAGSIAAIASDSRGALITDLTRPTTGHGADARLMTSGEAARAAFEFRQQRVAQRAAQRAQGAAQRPNGDAAANRTSAPESGAAPNQAAANEAATNPPNAARANGAAPVPQQIYREEVKARV